MQPKKRATASEQRARHWAERRRQREREEQQRRGAVIAEFGGDVNAMAAELLRYRHAVAQLGQVRAGAFFAIIKPREERTKRRGNRSAKSASARAELAPMAMSPERRAIVEAWPCWSCLDDRGAELRHAMAQGTLDLDDESHCSPFSGLPLGCCRIRSAPIVTTDDRRGER